MQKEIWVIRVVMMVNAMTSMPIALKECVRAQRTTLPETQLVVSLCTQDMRLQHSKLLYCRHHKHLLTKLDKKLQKHYRISVAVGQSSKPCTFCI
jgi:hypothetical protein